MTAEWREDADRTYTEAARFVARTDEASAFLALLAICVAVAAVLVAAQIGAQIRCDRLAHTDPARAAVACGSMR
jgi:hypothetical protein